MKHALLWLLLNLSRSHFQTLFVVVQFTQRRWSENPLLQQEMSQRKMSASSEQWECKSQHFIHQQPQLLLRRQWHRNTINVKRNIPRCRRWALNLKISRLIWSLRLVVMMRRHSETDRKLIQTARLLTKIPFAKMSKFKVCKFKSANRQSYWVMITDRWAPRLTIELKESDHQKIRWDRHSLILDRQWP